MGEGWIRSHNNHIVIGHANTASTSHGKQPEIKAVIGSGLENHQSLQWDIWMMKKREDSTASRL